MAQWVVTTPLNWISFNPNKLAFQNSVANGTPSIHIEISQRRTLLLVHMSRKLKQWLQFQA